jgi:hypothetical protein
MVWIGIVGALAACAVSAAIWWYGVSPTAASVEPLPIPPVASAPAPPVMAPKVAKPSGLFPAFGKKLPAKKAEMPVVKPVASAPTPNVATDRYLEALGSLTAAHLYQSFVNIGLLADAVESEQLEIAEAEKTLGTIVRLMTVVETQLDQIANTDLDANDEEAMRKIRAQAETLRSQAAALRAYWANGEAEQIAAFHDARAKAWSGIRDMLGLEDVELDMAKQADPSR